MVTSFDEAKYLKSDAFDQNIRVHIARLVTLSACIVARCESLHSNSTILGYDFDTLINDFRQRFFSYTSPSFIRVPLVCRAKARFSVQTWHMIVTMQRPFSIAKWPAVSGDAALLILYGNGGMLILPS